MIDASTLLLGPLAGPECRRASGRDWLIWVRLLPAVATGVVAFIVLWIWWIGQQIDPYHQPYYELRTALWIIEGMLVAFAMILAPAVLAGSLAGEKERGSIGLLLTTRVVASDIVLGKLAGRLTQVAMIELAALPGLLLFASLTGKGWVSSMTLVALPASVAFGGGGIALAASAMSRRGRDALLLVYLFDILFLLGPMVASIAGGWIALISPFEGMGPLVWNDQPESTLGTVAVWTVMGLAGLAMASWRLRPSCLSQGDDTRTRKRSRRMGWIPPLDERPMLWKELYIERVGTLGRAGRWIGGALVLWMGLGSVALAGLAAWGFLTHPEDGWVDWVTIQLGFWYGGSALYIGFLIQWAIGLRAAVAISSERERGTWDALLTSPLEGGEIIRGKLWGSLYALRWLVVSAVLAWTIAFGFGGMFGREYAEQLLGLVAIGSFMAAVGVRASLRSATATRAMGVTIGLWLGAYLLAIAVAWTVCLIVAIVCFVGWLFAVQAGLAVLNGRPWFPMSFRMGSDLTFYGLYLAGTVLVMVETRLRFDRVAGRMTAGAAAEAVDRLIHGRSMAPVRIAADEPIKAREAEPEEAIG